MKLIVPFLLSFALLIFFNSSRAQNKLPVLSFDRAKITAQDSIQLLNEYGKNKELIPEFTLPALIALSYFPELKNAHIRFIYKPAHSPFTTKPTFPSVIGNGSKREFTIIISDSSESKLQPVLIQHMDFNAQIGIIGHELSHVSDFSRRSFLSLIGSGVGHIFSSKYIDRFE